MKKNYLIYSFICSLSIMQAYSTEYKDLAAESKDETNNILSTQFKHNDSLLTKVSNNFKQSKSLIEDHLSSVKEAQLHFFWTRGYTFSDNPEYNPNRSVNIGGTEYKDKFFPYIDQLLQNSPNKLIVKLILDKMTMESNKSSIEQLQNFYKNRFQVAFIDDVEEKILDHFSDPSHKEKIRAIFKNATAGSPVLASDIYRILGMIYSHDQSSDPSETLYTYSDVDIFCHGMEIQKNTKFTESLFESKVDTKSAFYLGRSLSNNDVIKLRIENIVEYKKFCESILGKLKTQNSVIDHFTKLHENIKSCEGKNPNQIDMKKLIPTRVSNLIATVTFATGPKFLTDNRIKTDFKYPSKTAGSWYAPEDILEYKIGQDVLGNPANVIFWPINEATADETKAIQDFTKQCNNYLNFISAAFYAKPFGPSHPFNVALTKYLQDDFPYYSTEFVHMLKTSFKLMNQDISQSYNLKVWNDTINMQVSDVYFYKENGNKLRYRLLSSTNEVIKGTIDITVEEDLTRFILRENEEIILKNLSAQGHTCKPMKGWTYPEWQEKTIKRLIGNPTDKVVDYMLHYQRIIYVLKKLGIELPTIKIPYNEATLMNQANNI